MKSFVLPSRSLGGALAVAAAVLLAACGSAPMRTAPPVIVTPGQQAPQREPELSAFKAQLNGSQVVPGTDSAATGEMVAVLDRRSGLLRWRISFSNLSGPVTRAMFHSPAMSGEVSRAVLPVGRNVTSPYEGRANLTGSQQSNLLTGQWYVELSTARYPEGEIRGQLIEQR